MNTGTRAVNADQTIPRTQYAESDGPEHRVAALFAATYPAMGETPDPLRLVCAPYVGVGLPLSQNPRNSKPFEHVDLVRRCLAHEFHFGPFLVPRQPR